MLLIHLSMPLQTSRLKKRHPRWCQRWCHPEVAVCIACWCPSSDWCPLEWAHHTNSSRHAPLVTCTASDHIQGRSDVFVVRVRHTSLTFVFQFTLLLDVPIYILLVTVNLSCRRRELRHLAVAVSALLPPPFGTVLHTITVKVTLVEHNSLVV